MAETKRLEMIFKNDADKQTTISIENPKTDITEAEVKTAMDLIVSKNVFKRGGYSLVEAVEARIVNTQTTEYDLVL